MVLSAGLLLIVSALLLAVGSLVDRRYPLINVAVLLLAIALLIGR